MRFIHIAIFFTLFNLLSLGQNIRYSGKDFVEVGKVIPSAIFEIRYYTSYNFVGKRIPGYNAPIAYLTNDAATALKKVSDELESLGYRLKIFDAYRPQEAVNFFIEWGHDLNDTIMKSYFYPDVEKKDVFKLGYLAHRSGHTRGSTVDLTLFDMRTGKEVDMGGPYDFFGKISHFNTSCNISKEQRTNRKLLRDVMRKHGFKSIECEWWHFTLREEPFPDTYFKFSIE